MGVGKLLNLTLSNDNKILLTAGDCICWGSDGCVGGSVKKLDANTKGRLSDLILWDAISGKPIYKFLGNQVKTYATLNPDGKYVVAGDEGGGAFIWDVTTGKQALKLYDIFFGKYIKTGPKAENYRMDKTGMIEKPDDFRGGNIIALKFIDLQGDYLRFTEPYADGAPYAVLFNVNDPKPLKYLPLGRYPKPSVDDYSRNASIDTAPVANILVMGKANSGGILVYKFDPKKRTLTKIWNGD